MLKHTYCIVKMYKNPCSLLNIEIKVLNHTIHIYALGREDLSHTVWKGGAVHLLGGTAVHQRDSVGQGRHPAQYHLPLQPQTGQGEIFPFRHPAYA
jgi:hypothetical protein